MGNRATILDLVQRNLGVRRSGALQKIAEELEEGVCAECGKSIPPDTQMCAECAAKKASLEAQEIGLVGEQPPGSPDDMQKVSSIIHPARVEKLASALDQLVRNPHMVNWSDVIKRSSAFDVGPGETVGETPSPVSGAPKTDETLPPPPKLNPDLGESAAHPTLDDPSKRGGEPGQLRTDEEYVTPPAKTASLVDRIKYYVKQGEDASGNMNPEDRPPQIERPAEVTRQEALIAPVDGALKLTPRDAAVEPKKQMGDLLDEPMQSASTDKTLDQVMGPAVVDEAGAKIASARLIAKLASELCSCGGAGTCGPCKIKSTSEKRAAASASFRGGQS